MNFHPRMLLCGAITGTASAAIGAVSVVCMGSALGWLAGVMAGATIGGLAIGLASSRLLHDATACLAALGADEADHPPGTREAVLTERYLFWDRRRSTTGSLIYTTDWPI